MGIAKELGGVQQRTRNAPGSHQRASISSDLHGCVTWTSMPRVALELPDSAEQYARLFERDDPRLHVECVQHPSIAGCSLQNLGSEQRLAATVGSGAVHLAEWSAKGLCRSEVATMWLPNARSGTPLDTRSLPLAHVALRSAPSGSTRCLKLSPSQSRNERSESCD